MELGAECDGFSENCADSVILPTNCNNLSGSATATSGLNGCSAVERPTWASNPRHATTNQTEAELQPQTTWSCPPCCCSHAAADSREFLSLLAGGAHASFSPTKRGSERHGLLKAENRVACPESFCTSAGARFAFHDFWLSCNANSFPLFGPRFARDSPSRALFVSNPSGSSDGRNGRGETENMGRTAEETINTS